MFVCLFFFFFPCWFGYSCLSFRSCFTYMYAVACSWLSSCLSLSAYSSFDSILHRHCRSSLSACCSILAQHSFHAFGSLPLRRLFFACHLCMLSPKYTPRPLHFCLSFAYYSMALCLTLRLFTWLFYVNILWHKTTFAPQLRQPHLWHSAL